MNSFYGNTRIELLEGFTNIIEQDSVWDDTRLLFQNNRLLNKKQEQYLGILTPLYLGQNLQLFSGTYKSSISSLNKNVNIFKLKTNYVIDTDGHTQPQLTISHKVSFTDEIDYQLSESNNVKALTLTKIKGTTTYFFNTGTEKEIDLNENPISTDFIFSSLGPSINSEEEYNKFFIDNQGHISHPALAIYKIKTFDLNLANYENDYKVNHMCCGPEFEGGPKDEENFYLANNLKLLNTTHTIERDLETQQQNILVNCGNITDLYNQISPLYNLFVENEPLDGTTMNSNMFLIENYIKKYEQVEERMNGLNILIENNQKTSLYNFKSVDTLYNSVNDQNKLMSIIDSLDYINDMEESDIYQIPNTAQPSLFLQTINAIRTYKSSLLNTTFYKILKHIEEFYNTIILFIFGFKSKINNAAVSLLDPQQDIYLPKTINKSNESIDIDLLNQKWAYFKKATEYNENEKYFEKNSKGEYIAVSNQEVDFFMYPNRYYIYIEELPEIFTEEFINNKKSIFGNELYSILFLLWKWQMDIYYQENME